MKQSWRLETPQKQTLGYTGVSRLTNMARSKVMLTYRWMKGRNKRKLKVILEQCWKSKFNLKIEHGYYSQKGSQKRWATCSNDKIVEEHEEIDILAKTDMQIYNFGIEVSDLLWQFLNYNGQLLRMRLTVNILSGRKWPYRETQVPVYPSMELQFPMISYSYDYFIWFIFHYQWFQHSLYFNIILNQHWIYTHIFQNICYLSPH